MGIRISTAGLSQFIYEIPEGCIISVEGSIDPVKSVFVHDVVRSAISAGRRTVYVTSRSSEDVTEALSTSISDESKLSVVEFNKSEDLRTTLPNNGLLVLDSFSFQMLDRTALELREILARLRSAAKNTSTPVLLTVESDMLERRMEVIIGHLSDGIIRFMIRDSQDGVIRYISVPKWIGGRTLDKNIYYTYNGESIDVDLRSRVV